MRGITRWSACTCGRESKGQAIASFEKMFEERRGTPLAQVSATSAFDEEYSDIGIFAEPRGKVASSYATSNDNVVECRRRDVRDTHPVRLLRPRA